MLEYLVKTLPEAKIVNCVRMAMPKRFSLNPRGYNIIKLRSENVGSILKVALIVFLIANINPIHCSNETNDTNTTSDNITKRIKFVETISGRSLHSVYENGTFRTGNSLWDNILNKCTVNPSVSCLQKNVYTYLDESLDFGDVNIGDSVCFKKNNVDINKYTKEANVIYVTGSDKKEKEQFVERAMEEENEIDDDFEPESSFEEVTDALYGKGVKFLVQHDLKVKLPEMFFHGATLKVSPRALTKTGALVHIDFEPNVEEYQGRLFFHKIKKYVRKKLVMAALAIILVVKLIALKLVFVAPVILGVTTAKKLFLKFLLFLFPALSHIFKLCSWYHQSYHTSKLHHHHHLIHHHHHKQPHAPFHPPHGHGGHGGHGGQIVVRPHAEGPPSSHEHYPQDWELSGPGLGNEYIAADIHRNAISNFKPHMNDANDINAWGLGLPPGPSNVGEIQSGNNFVPQVVSPNGQKIPTGSGKPLGPVNPYYRNKKTSPKDQLTAEKEALIRAAALAARAPASKVRDEILRISAAKLSEVTRIKAETELVKQQQEILAAEDPDTVAAERFYGELIDRVDQILQPMGAVDPGCKERAICALYKDPFKHTPYSNLVSNELSKDSNELLPTAGSKMAVRYYRYVQAARDGQDQKECLNLYSLCNIDYS